MILPYVYAAVSRAFCLDAYACFLHMYSIHSSLSLYACACFRGSGPMPGLMPDQCPIQAPTRPMPAALC